MARAGNHDAVRAAIAGGTLHQWAAAQPRATPLQGRGVAWAARLPSGADVVVRHARHGGVLAPLTGDLFLSPSRAPRELDTALRLQAAGVPTPDVVAYVTYPAFGPFCRVDVATARVAGCDVPAAWAAAPTAAARDGIIHAIARLLRLLQGAGAHHPDLNVKNVLVSGDGGEQRAWVLDVDRVSFGEAGDSGIGRRNAQRLVASFRKWRALHALEIEVAHIRALLDGAGVAHGTLTDGWPSAPR